MGRRKKITLTQLDIIKTAVTMFLEKGYSATSPKQIAASLNMSPGNITFYFPAKEDMLAVLIHILTKFQWKTVQEIVDDGESPISAICFELTAMASMCEENEIARDLYLCAYRSQKSLTIIRRSDAARAKKVFRDFCPDWSDEQFRATEDIVSGIEYATLMTTPDSAPLKVRIAGAMDAILSRYHVPEERRKMKVEKAMAFDYLKYGRELFAAFKDYVVAMSEEQFRELLIEHKTYIS